MTSATNLFHDGVDISTGSVLEKKFQDEDEIIGYVEPWIASPGEEVAVKVRLDIKTKKIRVSVHVSKAGCAK